MCTGNTGKNVNCFPSTHHRHTTPQSIHTTSLEHVSIVEMPWAIVQTRGARGNAELLEVPETWIDGSYLWCPAGQTFYHLQKEEFSIRKSNWSKIRCSVKRSNIPTFSAARQLLDDMSGMSSSCTSDASVAPKKFKHSATNAVTKTTFTTFEPPFVMANTKYPPSTPKYANNNAPTENLTGKNNYYVPAQSMSINAPKNPTSNRVEEPLSEYDYEIRQMPQDISEKLSRILELTETNARVLETMKQEVADMATNMTYLLDERDKKAGSLIVEPPIPFVAVASEAELIELEKNLKTDDYHSKFVCIFNLL